LGPAENLPNPRGQPPHQQVRFVCSAPALQRLDTSSPS